MQAPVTCIFCIGSFFNGESGKCAKGENAVSLVSSVNIQLSALSDAWILISWRIYKPAALDLYCFQTMINQGAQGQILLKSNVS